MRNHGCYNDGCFAKRNDVRPPHFLVPDDKSDILFSHISFNITLPKLYAISLVYTLNVGNKMRDERTSSNGITIPTTAGVQTLHLARRSFGGTELGPRATDSTQRTGDHLERGLAINGRSTADQERKIDILAPTRRTSGEVNVSILLSIPL